MSLSPDRNFPSDPTLRPLARQLYEPVASLPIVSPHGHIDPRLFADPPATLGSPTDLFIRSDHYVTRMLYSQGVALEDLGIPRLDGSPVEPDPRRAWRIFCENFHLFRGTPSGLWLTAALEGVFGLDEKPSAGNADRLYDRLSESLASPGYAPRRLFEKFGLEVLCTTDAATDPLEAHRTMRASGWPGRVLPTFRPDRLLDPSASTWKDELTKLEAVSGLSITGFPSFIQALEGRRKAFQELGATAVDVGVLSPAAAELSPDEAEAIFLASRRGQVTTGEAARFTAHMLMELARMSCEDGLVLQIHPGSLRNHDEPLFERFGPDRGADIPVAGEFTRALRPLLSRYGSHPNLTLILFTLDESTYARELAPLAGYYPAVRLGPPWWFHDSPNGMARFFERVMETAGLYNTAGFNDDARNFCSLPARHDLWRRAAAGWAAGLVARHMLDLDEAAEMMTELAVGLARRAYKL